MKLQCKNRYRRKVALLIFSLFSCISFMVEARSPEISNQPFTPHSTQALNPQSDQRVINRPDFTVPNILIPQFGQRKRLLVIGWDPERRNNPAPRLGDVRAKTFGSSDSIQHYFSVNSRGRFTVNEVAVLGWYNADLPAEHYWAELDVGDTNGDGWISGHKQKWAEAIKKADAEFDFSQYDDNGNGVVEPNELGVLIVIPQNRASGTNRPVVSREYPQAEPLVVDGVVIPGIAEWYLGSPINFPVGAHELAHLLLGLPDMYGENTGFRASDYSLMDVTFRDSHIDPYHKRKLGWADQQWVRETGTYHLSAAAGSNDVLLLRAPDRTGEYFLVENRQRTSNKYDSTIRDTGLAVWHIITSPAIYNNLPPPPGVDPKLWAGLGFVGRGIRLLRSVPSISENDAKSLYDGSDRETGYDLLSEDSNPAHAELRWADGTPSGFSIKNISASADQMSAYIKLPEKPLPTCTEFEEQIRNLELEIISLQEELQTAPPALKPFLVDQISEKKAELAKLKASECTN